MATYQTYQSIGNREDLSDVIYNISPTDTPLLNTLARGKATAVYHEWQTDSLSAATTANAAVEGADASDATMSPTTRLGNYTQIVQKTIKISGTLESVDKAGRKSEKAYQLSKASAELKRDIEYALTRNQASSAGGVGTGRALASLESWLSTNKTSLGTGTAQTTAGFAAGVVAAPVDSTVQGTFTKAGLDAVIQACWTQGGEPDTIMVGPFNRTIISGFSGISTLQTDANAKGDVTLIGAVDFYKSNFGILKVVPNRFQRDRTAFVLDMQYWGVSFLRELVMNSLGKTGDNDKAQMVTELTLVSKNQAASGKVTDLTTS